MTTNCHKMSACVQRNCLNTCDSHWKLKQGENRGHNKGVLEWGRGIVTGVGNGWCYHSDTMLKA